MKKDSEDSECIWRTAWRMVTITYIQVHCG